ncbi:MAG: hypothetical protein JSS83_11560 [Cyanobacteria bacterium SZAS LIN-3]|nr:hypothetical protein [Cyanobacteria bacterium SZAS LIN-3]MBS2005916.1 hypothetical protein [Cyanobacteria bacterium SZAS TMP-1]
MKIAAWVLGVSLGLVLGQPQTLAADASSTAPAPSASPTPAASPAVAAPQNLSDCLAEIHETLRRMKGDSDDILHEVTRTQEVTRDGVAEDKTQRNMFPTYMGTTMTALDALSRDVLLPPRPHWLNNSFAQMLDLQSKLQAETANITRIVGDPECSSGARAQGMVLGDITSELSKDLGALEVLIRETPPKNAGINLAAHKIGDTISGMEKVCDRLWKEAPRKLKSR